MTPEKMQEMKEMMSDMRSMMADAPANVKSKMQAAMDAMDEWMSSQKQKRGDRSNMLGMKMK